MKLALALAAFTAVSSALPEASDELGWDLLLADDYSIDEADVDAPIGDDDDADAMDDLFASSVGDLLISPERIAEDAALEAVGDMADLLMTIGDDEPALLDPLEKADPLTPEMRRAAAAAAQAAAQAAAHEADASASKSMRDDEEEEPSGPTEVRTSRVSNDDDDEDDEDADKEDDKEDDEDENDANRAAAVSVKAHTEASRAFVVKNVEADPTLFKMYAASVVNPLTNLKLKQGNMRTRARHMSYPQLVHLYMTLLSANMQSDEQ